MSLRGGARFIEFYCTWDWLKIHYVGSVQVVVIFIIPRLNDSRVFNATKSLNFIVILQYVLRVLRISSWLKKATRTSGILAETAGAKAAFNLFLYMLASHVSLPFLVVYL